MFHSLYYSLRQFLGCLSNPSNISCDRASANSRLSLAICIVHKGTTPISCHESAKIFQNLSDLHAVCRLLCEVHEEYETNIKLAKEGYFVYDFALPLLLLHAFTFHTAENIANWLRICPRRQITVLDTHDGMGIDDISGLASVSIISA